VLEAPLVWPLPRAARKAAGEVCALPASGPMVRGPRFGDAGAVSAPPGRDKVSSGSAEKPIRPAAIAASHPASRRPKAAAARRTARLRWRPPATNTGAVSLEGWSRVAARIG
jgi:hypothetical protein